MKSENHSNAFPDLSVVPGKPVWTVPALLQSRAEVSPDAPAVWSTVERSDWQSLTWRQFRDQVALTAFGMRSLGLRRGDRVGIIAPSSPRWDIAQVAAMAAGCIVVGLDPHDTDPRLEQVAAQCRLAGVIAQDEALLAKLGAAARRQLRLAVTFERSPVEDVVSFAELQASNAPDTNWNEAHPDDSALIVFTSGTTGEPKGIAYTHRQVCGAVASILCAFPDIEPGSRLACWLPLSNLFQRMINLCAIGRNAQTFYVEDPRQIMQHLVAIAPHLFIGVPRFYEKLHAGICETIDAKPAWQRKLAHWAIRAGDRRARALRDGSSLSFVERLAGSAAERLVLRRIRSIMGSNLRYLISGSAPMPLWLLERYHALGFLVLEAYGTSESIVPVAANRPQRFRFGTVGQPMAGSEVKLAPDGELLLRGPGVFDGYLGEVNASLLDADGFLASGDYASIDADGFIALHGRKSEVFKTSTGRRIAPAIIEGHLRQIPYVEHAVVFGASRPFLTAVLAVSEPALRDRLGGGAPDTDPRATAEAVRADVAEATRDLPGYQRPAGAVLTTKPFSIAEGLITPNLKVRRRQVESAFRAQLDELFEALDTSTAAWPALVRDAGATLIAL